MAILAVFGALALLGLVLLPQWWVSRAMRRHSVDRPDLDGTGAELARDLLDRAGLADVKVERTDGGDHYDPTARAVRLSADVHDGRTVTAIAVAAHEVGHALQHAEGDPAFMRRLTIVGSLGPLTKLATIVLFTAPLVMLVVKSPLLAIAQVLLAVAMMAGQVLAHLTTLPVELDASFRRALPILKAGRYLPDDDIPAARSVLRAAAFTYVAAALVTLIDVTRWIRLWR